MPGVDRPISGISSTEGYGQLSISSSGLRAEGVSFTGGAAGVWGLIGAPADVDKAKPAGPQDSAAVVAHSTDGHTALIANSQNGVGVAGISHNPKTAAVSGSNPNGLAGAFTGNMTVTGAASFGSVHSPGAGSFASLTSAGNLAVAGQINLTGIISIAQGGDIKFAGDCAEQFDVVTEEAAEPGTVMVLGEAEQLVPCDRAYDTRVAGVISGAREYRPGLVLDQRDTGLPRRPVALIGKVYCKVDAAFGAIAVGDLLTTSATPGHGMKASDPGRAFGTTIGKALRPWDEGKGMIPVLVALS